MHVLVWFLLIVETESGSSMLGAVDAVLSRMGVVVAGVCVGDVARDGPEHGDVMGEERGGVGLSTSRFMVKMLPQSSLSTLFLCSVCTQLYSLYTLRNPKNFPMQGKPNACSSPYT